MICDTLTVFRLNNWSISWNQVAAASVKDLKLFGTDLIDK